MCLRQSDGLICRFIVQLRCNEHVDEEDVDAALTLLLPLCRSLATNWKVGNRKEAGVALAHITGSGSEASQVVTTLSRLLKKVEPVRLLEAHMASLRQSYEDWINNDPEELANDHPTDEEMAAFSEAEQSHEELFQALINQARRFSMSLGVNKLSDKKLSPALLGFIREGIRFSFSASDELVIGSRLSLTRCMKMILQRYLSFEFLLVQKHQMSSFHQAQLVKRCQHNFPML